MKFSTHAWQRWQQRCSHLDLTVEVDGARRAGKAMLNRLRRNWERAQGVGTWPASQDYLVTPGGCLLVVGNEVVITVMMVRDLKQWGARQDREDRLKRRNALL